VPGVQKVTQNAVFLNIPYGPKFRSLYVAYIVGLVQLGLIPRLTLRQPGRKRRLDKILSEIRSCRYSIHDLSMVGVDRNPPPSTPRFNMPFELGLAVVLDKLGPERHIWFVFEAQDYRLLKSLSDLNGTDPQIHKGTVHGVMSQLLNIFRRVRNRPTLHEMMHTYNTVSRRSAKILARTGAASLFEARAFEDLCVEAKIVVDGPRALR
jgi:hypothetical protein